MKMPRFRATFTTTIAAIGFSLGIVSAFAVPVTDEEAATAAASLVAAGGAMDARMEGGVSEVRALTPPDGAAPFRVVKFAEGGFIVTSGDTEDDPFVFISDGPGDVVEDNENPLWGILRHNMSANEAVRATNATARSRGVRAQSVSTAENKWAKWLSGGNGRVRTRDVAVPGTSISDICVPRIMDVRWNQRGSGNASHYYNDAIPHHSAVGCVAVAMAQVIRHYRWPATIGVVTNSCRIWNGQHGAASQEETVLLATSGATYDWSAMPAAPDLYVNPPGQTDVSRFLYDAGITVGMNWHAPDDDTSEDGGSGGSSIRYAADALRGIWGYTNAVWSIHGAVVPDENPPSADDRAVIQKVKDIYLPCLAAGMPVIASITGHDVVADGYGYSAETLYFHINYGWGGTNSSSTVNKNTGWYVATLPIQGHETGISSSIYNISTNAVGSLFSGRVRAANGSPLGNHQVVAVGANGGRHTTLSNAAGVYVFNLQPGSYVVLATSDNGMAYGDVVTVQNKSSVEGISAGTIGNVSGVDLRLGTPDKFVWTGRGDGTRFGVAGNWNLNQVPTNGATIVLAASRRDETLNNDLPDFRPSEIFFAPSPYSCTITNKALNGVNRIVSGSSATNMFKVAVAFAGDIDVIGAVAFADGGSATGAKPVNHTDIIGLYNLTASNWTPGVGVTIHTNSVVNVPSMMLTSYSELDIEAGGTLNVAGDVILTHRSVTSATIARTNDGQINVYGCISSTNAHAYPCYYGNGRIYAREVVNNSKSYEFNLFARADNADNVVSWEIGEGGLRWGLDAVRRSLASKVFYAWGKSSKALEIKARSDFVVDGDIYLGSNTRLDTDGHTITLAAFVDGGGSGPLTLTGGGTVKMVYDTWSITNWTSTFSAYIPPSRLYVDPGTTLSLDSGSYLTKGTNTVSAGATLVLPMTNPGFGATLGSLHMEGGSLLVVSNFTGEAAALALTRSFARTGDGPVCVRVMGPAPISERTVLATGFRGADVSDFSLERTGVAGPNTVLELVNGTLYIGAPSGNYVWNGSKSAWGDAGAWTLNGAPATWEDLNNAVFSAPGSEASLAADVVASQVRFTADATVVGESVLDAKQVSVSQGVVATIDAPLGPELEKTGPGTLAITHGRGGVKTILTEGTLKFMFGDDALDDTVAKIEWGTDPAKKVAIDCSGHKLGEVMTHWLPPNIDVTLTNGTFGMGFHDLAFTEAKLPAVLTVAEGAVMSNIQHRININDGSTHVINFAGGKMYNTKTSGGNHYLMQASTSGRLDINVTDGGLLEFWNELYALTCRDGEGYVDPSLHMTFRDSTFRITNNKSFRFGWDGNNKNAVAPVGVFAATNSVFEAYGFFLGNDVVGTHTAGSYTADFEGCVISARQFRVFHDRPLNAVRFNNTRMVLTANDSRWLLASDEFVSLWGVNPISVGEGGLVMDSNGKDGSLVANLQGPGAVIKAGRGRLTVSRDQTGAGPFVCQAGEALFEAGRTVSRPVTVKGGAKLSVSCSGSERVSFGGVAFESGATLDVSGCTESAAAMRVTSLTLPDGTAALTKDGGAFPAGSYAILVMDGVNAAQVQGRLVPQVAAGQGGRFIVVNGNMLKLVVGSTTYVFVPAVAPTCENPGTVAHWLGPDGFCYDGEGGVRLEESQMVIPALGHDFVAGTPVEPTCTTQGHTPYVCSRCGAAENRNFVPALGHAWSAWTVVTPPTAMAAGEEARDCSRCGAHETQTIPMIPQSTFTAYSSGNTFRITRSNGSTTETIYYRTVGISAFAGQNFVGNYSSLTFEPGVTNLSVTVTERATPSNVAYRYQTGTTRSYRFEVLDAGGFSLVTTPLVRTMTTGTQFSTSYLNRAVTNLVYFTNSGSITSGSGNKYLDVTCSGTASYIQVTEGGYKQGVRTISTGNLFGNSSDLRSYLHGLDYKMYATIFFTQKEEQDGYQYIQILADNASTYDGDDGNGTVSTPSTALYKACFILSYNPSGSVMSDDHYQFFPHRYDYVDKAAEKSAGISQYEFDYDNSHLYKQAFRSSSYKAPTSGSLVLPVTNTSLNVRFDAAGSGGDNWDFKNLKARLALVDATPPRPIDASVSTGPYHRGNTVSVSLAFNEIVVPVPSSDFYLNTTWGLLGYDSSSSGGNVLTFSGKIGNSIANGTRLSIEGFVSLTSVKDLAGNAVASGSIQLPSFPSSFNVAPSVDYTIAYDLAGGTLPPDEDPNPTSYSYDSDIIALTNPVRPGYNFAGWSGTDLNGIVTDVFIRQYRHGNRVYTAHWTPIAYPISYDGATNGVAGVSNPNQTSYTVEDGIITLVAPTRPNYTFGGWFADVAHTEGPFVSFSASDMAPKTFYAAWNNFDWANEGRSGDSEEDAYLIYTPRQLDLLAQRVNDGNSYSGKFFRVMADIAYDPSVPNNFTPIGEAYVSTAKITVEPSIEYSFDGTFDGNGHVLSGIRLSQAWGGMRVIHSDPKVAGLFCKCGSTATIKNLILANAEIEGDSAGGIVGKCEGTVSNCFVIGTTVTAGQGGVVVGDVNGSASLVDNNYHDCVLVVCGESRVADIGTPEGDIPGGAEECYAITTALGVVVASEPDFAFLVCGVTNRCWNVGSSVRLEYADPLSAGQLAVFSVNGEQIAGNVFEMPATNATVSVLITDGHVWNAPAYAWADDYSCVTGTVSSSSGDYFHESVFAATSVVSRAATCTETGETTWIADVPQDNVFGFATQTTVQHGVPVAVGHIWVKKSWTWAEDCSAASVLLECARCDAQTNVSAVVTLAGKTWDAFTWRATAEIDGQTFTDYPMFQDREKYTVEAGVGEGGSFKVCYVKSNAWGEVLVDFAEIDYNVSPKDRHKSPAGESIYIVPKDSELAIVSASASGEPLALLWDSVRGLSYFIMPAHAVTVSVVFNSKYPRYLDGADDDVWDCYDEWAAEYGNDVFGTNEVAFLLNVAPEAVTNGVTLLKIVELGVTNRLVSESGDYGLVAKEMLGYSEDDYLTYRRIVLASDVTELTQRSAFGYQGDICNGYLVLHIGIDLSEPRENWLAFSWPCEVVDGQVVLEFPELLLEKYRESVARDTGAPCTSLFFSASISTKAGDPPYELMAAIYQATNQGGNEESEP